MKQFLHIPASACLVLLMLVSCKKSFLDEKIYSNYSPAALADSLGFEAAFVGLNNQLSTIFTHSNYQGFIDAWQVGTDVCYPTAPEGSELPFSDYSTLGSTNVVGSTTWTWAYAMINNANIVVTNVENPTTVMGQ